jgi:hypothetical protein
LPLLIHLILHAPHTAAGEAAENDLQLAWENLETAKVIWSREGEERHSQQLAGAWRRQGLPQAACLQAQQVPAPCLLPTALGLPPIWPPASQARSSLL